MSEIREWVRETTPEPRKAGLPLFLRGKNPAEDGLSLREAAGRLAERAKEAGRRLRQLLSPLPSAPAAAQTWELHVGPVRLTLPEDKSWTS